MGAWLQIITKVHELDGQVLDADEGYQKRLKAASELLLGGTFDKES